MGSLRTALFEPLGGGGSVFTRLDATEARSLTAVVLLVADLTAVLLLFIGADLMLGIVSAVAPVDWDLVDAVLLAVIACDWLLTE